MRSIEYDDLESERIGDIQYVRDKHCKGRSRMCFTCSAGVMGNYCEHFRIGKDGEGFKCDDGSILAQFMQQTTHDDRRRLYQGDNR